MTTEAPSGSPRRTSGATKAAILEAARERFATDGYERATIRSIARDAGIDPSMVMRYYGNKEGLFAAASEIDLRMPELGSLPGKHIGAALVAHFLDRWEADDVLTALLRVGVTNAAGAERVQTIFAEQLIPVATGVCPDPDDAPRRAVLVASQILGMAMARYVLRIPTAVAMTREEVVGWLAPTVQRYLTAERP
ncbi:TetR family transcriptional regulator [Streptomyces sp. NPDC001691]|uniref:TetR/AcrR family transcriptional regulator n=1 Tax=unclassified Streptomyces TaxID=2593676 RepID=UPI000DE94063|nr:TetR family transcriptional regulator [Streptomyces sp. SDr-06]RCH64775.1 TetR/AcrR family transcriptional regulator [Streptomyces sp. SDr-06]